MFPDGSRRRTGFPQARQGRTLARLILASAHSGLHVRGIPRVGRRRRIGFPHTGQGGVLTGPFVTGSRNARLACMAARRHSAPQYGALLPNGNSVCLPQYRQVRTLGSRSRGSPRLGRVLNHSRLAVTDWSRHGCR
jgi:hypothetical protein